MSSTEFSKSLLKSASIDAPATGAKARAMASVGSAAGTAATVTATAAATKLGLAITMSALIAGAAGLGGGYALGHASSRPAEVRVETQKEILPVEVATHESPTLTITPPPIATTVSTESAAPVDSCKSVSVASSNKCTVSGGRAATFALKNGCSQATLDVFWVDSSCREIFRGMLAPSETFWRDSFEGQVYRVRDHATHRLLKEFSPVAVSGTVDREKAFNAPATELPLVTIAASDMPIPEAPPPICSHYGGHWVVVHVRNDRNAPIALSMVSPECKEVQTQAIDPGATVDKRTGDGYAYRIRDASGGILMDLPPTGLDTNAYVSVP